jgi:hypothetical protein
VRYSTQIKPISYLKANAAKVLHELTAQLQPLPEVVNRLRGLAATED